MLDFYHRRFQVLVCTTIIESGIDVPTANTILIDRADRFGLAQLHQLRGRVGRSHHRAFAYLLAPPAASLPDDARKRLEAIESLEDLGAGFTLATQDLEIRGAGELLGEEQSGQIQEIGIGLYLELLERAVAALREGREPRSTGPLPTGCEVDLQLPGPAAGGLHPRRAPAPAALQADGRHRRPRRGSTTSRPRSSTASARCRRRQRRCSSCTACASALRRSASAGSSSATTAGLVEFGERAPRRAEPRRAPGPAAGRPLSTRRPHATAPAHRSAEHGRRIAAAEMRCSTTSAAKTKGTAPHGAFASEHRRRAGAPAVR